MAKSKKTNEKEKEKPKSLLKPSPEDVIHAINMKHGKHGPVIRTAANAWRPSDLRRPCGIASLDIATGGGLVAGGANQVDGPESTGKNFLLYNYFAQIQKNYGNQACLAMACFESFVDKHFAQMCGCKIAMSEYDIEVTNRQREKQGEPPLTKKEREEALNCDEVGHFHIFEGPAEDVLDGIIDAVRSNIYQMIGIDSWDSMMTMAEDKADLGEIPQVASPATIQTRFAKKLQDAFNPVYRCANCGYSLLEKRVTNYDKGNYKYVCPQCDWKGLDPVAETIETSLYCIRQARAKLAMGGKVYGRAYKTQGAFALQHLNDIRVSLHPGQYSKDGNVKTGKEINWEISKAKVGAKEGAVGSFQMYFSPVRIDAQDDLFNQCVKHGVIQKLPASMFEVPGIEMDRVKGKQNFLDLMEAEPELEKSLRDLLYTAVKLDHVRFT